MKTQGLRGGVLLRRVVFSTPRMSRNCLVFRWRLNNKLNITWLLGDMKLPFECKKKNIHSPSMHLLHLKYWSTLEEKSLSIL